MALKPDASIIVGLSVAGVVYAIHSNMTPTVGDVKSLPAGNKDIDKSERQATIMSIGVVSGISLLAKDPTIFTIGAFAVVGMSLVTKHANWTESATGLIAAAPGQSAVSADDLSDGPQMMSVASYQSDFVSS